MYPRIITVTSIVVELLGAYFTVQSRFNIVFTSIYLTLITFILILSLKISKLPTDEKRACYWIIFLIMLLTGLSYVGPFGIIDVITFPYEIPLVIFATLGLHFMEVKLSKYRLEVLNYTSITNSSEARNHEDN